MFSQIQALRKNQRQAGIVMVDHERDCSPHATAFLNFFTLVINKTAATLVTIVNTSYCREIVAEQDFFAKKYFELVPKIALCVWCIVCLQTPVWTKLFDFEKGWNHRKLGHQVDLKI